MNNRTITRGTAVLLVVLYLGIALAAPRTVRPRQTKTSSAFCVCEKASAADVNVMLDLLDALGEVALEVPR